MLLLDCTVFLYSALRRGRRCSAQPVFGGIENCVDEKSIVNVVMIKKRSQVYQRIQATAVMIKEWKCRSSTSVKPNLR